MNWDVIEELKRYERSFGGPGISTPADHCRDVYCKKCGEMVRLVFRPPEHHHCPLCGRRPGLLEMGTRSVQEWNEASLNEDGT